MTDDNKTRMVLLPEEIAAQRQIEAAKIRCQGCKKEMPDGKPGHINYCSYECYCDD